MTQKSLIKMQISPIKNQNLEKPSSILSNRTKVKILKKKMFWISLKKNLVPRMLSHRGNIRTSKFWRKSKEKRRNFFSKIYKGHIRIWFRSKKNSKLSHACVPLKMSWFVKIPPGCQVSLQLGRGTQQVQRIRLWRCLALRYCARQVNSRNR